MTQNEAAFEQRVESVMHRLRTPLTSIKGWTELVERRMGSGAHSAELRAYIFHTMEAVREMSQAIDDIAAEAHSRAGPGQTAPEALPSRSREDVRLPSRARR